MIAAIVLAAGGAQRFGAQKLLAPVAGRPVVRWTVEHALASRAQPVIVVLGYESEAVRAALDGLPARFIINKRWAEGMSTSLHAGLAALPRDATGALIVLGDQPTIPARVYDQLISAHATCARPIIVPSYRGERGSPVLFATGLIPELLAVQGDRGARDVIARDPERVGVVELELAMPPDVDTAADLAQVEREVLAAST